MFNITEEQRKQLLQYMWNRPYGEVAQLITMLASIKNTQENIQENKNANGKKDVPKVSGERIY